MKTSFLIMSIKSLIAIIGKLKAKLGESTKFLTEEDAFAIAEVLSRYYWLNLVSNYRDSIDVKKKRSIPKVHEELKDEMSSFPELAGFNIANGNPGDLLLKNRGKTALEIIDASGNKTKCVPIDDFLNSVDIVMNYNFGSQFKKEVPDFFKAVEPEMAALARDRKWAARGSWNSRVDHEETEKKEINLDFLDFYGTKPEKEEGEGTKSNDETKATDPESEDTPTHDADETDIDL